MTRLDRRRFLKSTTTTALGATLAASVPLGGAHAGAQTVAEGEFTFPRRVLGKTGETVSMLGLGGHHLARISEAVGIRLIHRALDLGINFIDSADCYQGGGSERIIGKAIADRRDTAYIMTKVDQRDRDGARKTLETSLANFGVETIDLWQFHAVPDIAQVDQIFAPGGAWEVAEEARRKGQIRHIGITGHTRPEALVHALRHYHERLDTVQMPINVLDPSYSSFVRQVLPLAVEHQVAPLAMKTAAAGSIIRKGIATVEECLRFAWSQPVAVLISGMERENMLEANAASALAFSPMTPDEQDELIRRVARFAGRSCENYKAAV